MLKSRDWAEIWDQCSEDSLDAANFSTEVENEVVDIDSNETVCSKPKTILSSG